MPRDPAEFVDAVDPAVRIILAELNESAGIVDRAWTLAVMALRNSPEYALEQLIEAEIHLNIHIRIELRDALRDIRGAIARFPDDPTDDQ